MKAGFALNLSHEGISLLHRTSQGWMALGAALLDDPKLGETLGFLRATAAAMAPGGITTKLILPNSEILYTTVTAPGPDDAARAGQIRAALEGLTPYDLADLVFDWSGEGDRVQVAVVARETLNEAENFAADHRMNPICFVSIPDQGDFDGEPFFGPTGRAARYLPAGEMPERDSTPIRIDKAGSSDARIVHDVGGDGMINLLDEVFPPTDAERELKFEFIEGAGGSIFSDDPDDGQILADPAEAIMDLSGADAGAIDADAVDADAVDPDAVDPDAVAADMSHRDARKPVERTASLAPDGRPDGGDASSVAQYPPAAVPERMFRGVTAAEPALAAEAGRFRFSVLDDDGGNGAQGDSADMVADAYTVPTGTAAAPSEEEAEPGTELAGAGVGVPEWAVTDGAVTEGAVTEGAVPTDGQANISEASMSGASISGASISGASISGASGGMTGDGPESGTRGGIGQSADADAAPSFSSRRGAPPDGDPGPVRGRDDKAARRNGKRQGRAAGQDPASAAASKAMAPASADVPKMPSGSGADTGTAQHPMAESASSAGSIAMNGGDAASGVGPDPDEWNAGSTGVASGLSRIPVPAVGEGEFDGGVPGRPGAPPLGSPVTGPSLPGPSLPGPSLPGQFAATALPGALPRTGAGGTAATRPEGAGSSGRRGDDGHVGKSGGASGVALPPAGKRRVDVPTAGTDSNGRKPARAVKDGFGTESRGAVGGKPRYLGLVLTVALLVALAAAAVVSSYLAPNEAEPQATAPGLSTGDASAQLDPARSDLPNAGVPAGDAAALDNGMADLTTGATVRSQDADPAMDGAAPGLPAPEDEAAFDGEFDQGLADGGLASDAAPIAAPGTVASPAPNAATASGTTGDSGAPGGTPAVAGTGADTADAPSLVEAPAGGRIDQPASGQPPSGQTASGQPASGQPASGQPASSDTASSETGLAPANLTADAATDTASAIPGAADTGTAQVGTASAGATSAGTVSAGTVSAGTASVGATSVGATSAGTTSAGGAPAGDAVMNADAATDALSGTEMADDGLAVDGPQVATGTDTALSGDGLAGFDLAADALAADGPASGLADPTLPATDGPGPTGVVTSPPVNPAAPGQDTASGVVLAMTDPDPAAPDATALPVQAGADRAPEPSVLPPPYVEPAQDVASADAAADGSTVPADLASADLASADAASGGAGNAAAPIPDVASDLAAPLPQVAGDVTASAAIIPALPLTVATPEGARTPEGILVTLGKPAVVPAARPQAVVAAAAARLAAEVQAPGSGVDADAVADAVAGAVVEALSDPALSDPTFVDPLADKRPRARPQGVGVGADQTGMAPSPPGDTVVAGTVSTGPEPRARPQTVLAAAQAAAASLSVAPSPDLAAGPDAGPGTTAPAQDFAGASVLAVSVSRVPVPRPRTFAASVEAALAEVGPPPADQTAPDQPAIAQSGADAGGDQLAAVAPSELDEPEPTSAAPIIPTRASVARQATFANAINLSKVNLIGVYGSSGSRRALVRMANGKFVKVKIGDRFDGGKVAGISETQLSYTKNGRTTVLTLLRDS